MKLSASLLHAISLGITVGVLSTACHKNEVNSGKEKQEKAEKEKERKHRDDCPTCGMG